MSLRVRTLLVLIGICFTMPAWAISIGPAMFKVQNIVPGQSLDVRKASGVVFTVRNDSAEEGIYNLVCQRPTTGGLIDWERGYEEVPDAAWFRLEKNDITVPAKGKVEVGLVIDVPDKPEFYNCKWMLAVVLSAGKSEPGRVGVGLALASRIQIETARSDDAESGKSASISTVPCIEIVQGKPGEQFERSVILRNNTQRVLDCVSQRLVEIYSTEEFKFPRYTSPGYTALLKETWLKGEVKFSLKPGDKHEYKVAGQIPATAKAGDKFEELVFITAPAAVPGDKGPAGRETRTFFRVRFDVAAEKAK